MESAAKPDSPTGCEAARRYRLKAEECRVAAEAMLDARARSHMEAVAHSYEVLAGRLERVGTPPVAAADEILGKAG